VLQCVAVCYSELHHAASRTFHNASMIQCVTLLQYVAVCCSVLHHVPLSVLQYVAVCCSVLQCVAMCCNALQCATVCCIACLAEIERDPVQCVPLLQCVL